jgi:hypothetical protein
LVKPRSLTARLFRFANTIMFGSLDAIIAIGRDVAPLLLAYKSVTQAKINFIPNWTLLPVGYREPAPGNRFRAGRHSQLIVGLSGNLGFTHSPLTVFEADAVDQMKLDGAIFDGYTAGVFQRLDLHLVIRARSLVFASAHRVQ